MKSAIITLAKEVSLSKEMPLPLHTHFQNGLIEFAEMKRAISGDLFSACCLGKKSAIGCRSQF